LALVEDLVDSALVESVRSKD